MSTSICAQDPHVTTDNQVGQLVAKARAAQAAFESFSQEQVDAIVKGTGAGLDGADQVAKTCGDTAA